jgi:tRNA(Ile)-lysidine synthase
MKTRGRAQWRNAVSRIAPLLPRERLHPGVVTWADQRPKGERWAVALSGGSDSVALLLALLAHWPERARGLVALHFDHRLRGAESTADARFCRGLCAELGVEYVGGRWASRSRQTSEAGAREARFVFIERAMRARRIRVLWLGHQQDDVAETMLMRLARGSGAAGLAAPRPVHLFEPERGRPGGRFHVRPLLTLGKREIAKALRGAGAPWREDSSNANASHFRNRLRKSVIGGWVKASERDALAGAALSRELLEEDDRALESWVDATGCFGEGGYLGVSKLLGRPTAVLRRALYRWLLSRGKAGVLSRQGFEMLLRSVERGTPVRHSLGRHGFAVIRGGRLSFESLRKSAVPH